MMAAVYVLCPPVTNDDPPSPSLALACDACGVAVWLSDATRLDLADAGDWPVALCIACGAAMAKAAGEGFQPPGPRTRAARRA